ncbi:pseudouridine synthase [Planctomycetales bacterium]|nr:pseudouridine synthase [Planctomycetales bacterium]GHT04458.1 pseudouridine synthase [Planctomycetales bacterium]
MRYQTGEKITFTVNRPLGDARPRRLCDYVAARLGISGKRADRLGALGAVKFNGETVAEKTARPVTRGDVFTIEIPADWLPHLVETPMALAILYEDEFFIAVNKPSGILVHPARGHAFGDSLQNGVLWHYRADRRPDKTIAPPHRLDKDTSGAMLFSRSQKSYIALCRMFKNREVRKTYWALVEGSPPWDATTADAPLGVHPQNPTIGAVVADGKTARTEFIVKRRGAKMSLVEASPHTGRAHQIRLHLQHLGYPIIGDRDYNPDSAIAFPRQALHALSLAFVHPLTGTPLTIAAPLAADFAAGMQEIGKATTN